MTFPEYNTAVSTRLHAVKSKFPYYLRQYITRAGESGDFYLTPPNGAPIEVRYHSPRSDDGLAWQSPVCIVPDVGMADGLPVWVWSAQSMRFAVGYYTTPETWRRIDELSVARKRQYDALEAECMVVRNK